MSKSPDAIMGTVGDILGSGNMKGAGRTEAYIHHLKTLYGVAEDQELAVALGSTKSALAKWRARDSIPAAIENKVSKEFGGQHFWWVVEDGLYRKRWEDDAYALCLHIMSNEALPSFPEELSLPVANISLRGQIFAALLTTVRRHIDQRYSKLSSGIGVSDSILMQCLEDYAAGRIRGLEDVLSLVPSGRR